MFENARSLFDIPSDVTYLNCAAQSPHTLAAKVGGEAGIAIKSNPWTLDPEFWNRNSDELRNLFAQLIGATGSDIALVPSTAYGVATAAANLPLKKGQDIVLIEGQYPSNVIAWEKLATDKGGVIKEVARPDDYNWTPWVIEAITDQTAIVTLPPCHWMDGSKLDLVAIGARCRQVGAALVIDATQVVGAMELDIDAIEPDFLIASGYKWLLNPIGSAYLYAAPKQQEGKAIEHSTFNCLNRDPVSGTYAAKKGAQRYDMGGRNNFVLQSMALKSLQQINEWGPGNIQRQLTPLTDLVAAQAEERGWKVPGKNNRVGHIIGITFPEGRPENAQKRLAAENIFVSERGTGLRVSPYLYNTKNDIERFFEVMDKIIKG